MNGSLPLIRVKGLRVLVTGSTRGIGRAIAEAFARHEAKVLVTGRNGDSAKAVAREIGHDVTGHALDVAFESSVQALAETVAHEWGGIDVLVNNAGIDPHYAGLEDTSTDSWRQILATNLDGVFFCSKHFGRMMLGSGGGNIINVSSVGGKVALKKQLPYCASKGAVEQITRSLAMEWAERGVRVNGIGYGFIETDLTSGMTTHPHIAPRLLARTPMNRFGKLHEVAGAAMFLASSAASFVTGHTLMVDGGWTAA